MNRALEPFKGDKKLWDTVKGGAKEALQKAFGWSTNIFATPTPSPAPILTPQQEQTEPPKDDQSYDSDTDDYANMEGDGYETDQGITDEFEEWTEGNDDQDLTQKQHKPNKDKDQKNKEKENKTKLNDKRSELFGERDKEYVVKDRDNVWKIAKEHGKSVEEIEDANPWLKNRKTTKADGSVHYNIRPGEKVNIPQSSQGTGTEAGATSKGEPHSTHKPQTQQGSGSSSNAKQGVKQEAANDNEPAANDNGKEAGTSSDQSKSGAMKDDQYGPPSPEQYAKQQKQNQDTDGTLQQPAGSCENGQCTTGNKPHEQLDKFKKLVTDEGLSALEMNKLKDSVYMSNVKDIERNLIENNVKDITLEKVSSNNGCDKRGFFGALFSKTMPDGSKVYFEVIRGTDTSPIEFIRDHRHDNSRIYDGKLPEQLKSAEEFHRQVLDITGGKAHLYVFGHSLGGAISQLMGAKYTQDYKAIIDFDGYGMQEIIDNHLPNTDVQALREKMVSFKASPNKINTFGTPVVDPIIIDHPGNKIPRDWATMNPVDVGTYTLRTHSSEKITEGFDHNGPKNVYDNFNWPKGDKPLSFMTMEQKLQFYSYKDNKRAWDDRWHKDYYKDYKSIDVGCVAAHSGLNQVDSMTADTCMIDLQKVYPTYAAYEAYAKNKIDEIVIDLNKKL